MRITDRIIFESANGSIARIRERAAQAAKEASSGVRVEHPGDDPTVAGAIVTGRATEARLAAIGKAVERAYDELLQADTALGSLGTGLNRALQLATQLANSTYSPENRRAAAEEIDAIVTTAVGLLNTRVGDRYLFGGFKDGSPPFAADGSYLGDDGVRKVEIAPGVFHEVSIRADVAIKGAGGGVDIFQVLADLKAALESGNGDAVQAAIDPLQRSIDQVAIARARAGAAQTVLESAREAARVGKDAATEEVSRLADADLIDAASRMQLAQRALDAALSVAARSFELSLVDKLR